MSTDKYHFFPSFLLEEIHFSVPTRSQDDYTRCRRVAEVPKIRVTSQGGPCQFVYIFHMIQFEKLSLFNAEIDSV